MPVERTVSIPITYDGDRVILSKRDWERVLGYIGNRDVSINTTLNLKPRTAPPKMKRGPYKKKKVTETK
jgi:hypothetical protein